MKLFNQRKETHVAPDVKLSITENAIAPKRLRATGSQCPVSLTTTNLFFNNHLFI